MKTLLKLLVLIRNHTFGYAFFRFPNKILFPFSFFVSLKKQNLTRLNQFLVLFFLIAGTSWGQTLLVNFDSTYSSNLNGGNYSNGTNNTYIWVTENATATVANNIISTSLNRGSNILASGTPANNSIGGSGGWSDTSTDETSFIFEFYAIPNYKMSLSSLTGYSRRSNDGPLTCNVDYSLNGGITYNSLGVINTTSTTTVGTQFTLTLSSIPSLQNICPGTKVKIRLNPIPSSNQTNNWYLMNRTNSLRVYGTLTALTIPTFTQVLAVCSGATISALPTTSTNGIAGTWSPSVNNTTTTTYTFTPTTESCATTTMTISVNPLPSQVSITPSSATVCAGANTILTASGGISSTNSTNIIGTGTNAIGSTSTGPNPFNSWYGGTKVQMIYTAAELITLGLVNGGTIKSVGLYIDAYIASACTDLTIRMKNTSSTSLTGFETGTSLVYGPLTFIPSATGWINFSLTTPFVWTGGNIIVEFVHNSNNTGNGFGTTTRYTTTTSNSTFFLTKDNAGFGISGFDSTLLIGTGEFGVSTSRPNIKIGYSIDIANSFTWTPITGLYTNSNATTAYTGANATTVYAKPATTQTYNAKAKTTFNCSTTGSSTITVNQNPSTTLIYHQ